MTLPNQMRIIEMTSHGAPDVLTPTTTPMPTPEYGQVLIEIAYAGVNRPDVLQRAGLYHPPKGASPRLGLECAGRIAAIGDGVFGLAIGDLVCALLPGGGYAAYAIAPASHCLPIPDGCDLKQAACLPETVFTVWSNVFMRAELKAGERILIHGGSSGIGTTAIQLARSFGARVFTTAGSDEKCKACIALGAEHAINYRTDDFQDIMKDVGGAHVILDMVGGSYIERNINTLADDGRLIQIAFLEGPKTTLNMMQMMTRRLTLTGSTLRPQSDIAKAEIAKSLRIHVWPRIASGQILPVIDREFPLEQAAKAHAYMETNAHIGKIVLRVAG